MSGKDDRKKESKKEVTPHTKQSSVASFLNGMKKVLRLVSKEKPTKSVSENASLPLGDSSTAPAPPSPPPNFNNTFASNREGLNIPLANLLDSKSLSSLSRVSRGTRKVYGEAVYRALIKEEIGPNPDVLIESSETAKAAYERHKKIISGLGLGAMASQMSIERRRGSLVDGVERHPNYYFKHIVKDEDFDSYFPSYEGFLDALKFIEKTFPTRFDLVMNRIIADLDRITRLIDAQPTNGDFNHEKWCTFFREFQEKYAGQLIREMLANNKLFIRMIPTSYALRTLTYECDYLGLEGYSKNIRNQVLARNDIFMHFFGSVEGFQQFIANCVISSFSAVYNKEAMVSHLASVVEKILNDNKLFALVLGDENKLQAFRASFSEKLSGSSKCFLDCAKPEALMLIERAEERFAEFLKDKASQQDAKGTAPLMRASDDQSASSSFTTTSLYEASGSSIFASRSPATSDFPQGQALVQEVREVKEEAKQGSGGSNLSASISAADLPAGDKGEASTQTSSGSSSSDLPSGDGEEASGNGPPHR